MTGQIIPKPLQAVGLLSFVAAFTLFLVLHPIFDERTFLSVENVAGSFAPGLAALMFWRTSRGTSRAGGSAWLWMAAGCGVWAIGEIVWVIYHFLGTETPFPSLADAFYFSSYPLFFHGILKLGVTKHGRVRLQTSLDALAVVAAAGTVLSTTIISPIFSSSGISLTEKVIAAAYPMADLALIYGALIALSRARQTKAGTVLGFLIAGLLVITLTDVAFAYSLLDESYVGFSYLDAGWVAGFCILAYSAALQAHWQPSYRSASRFVPSWRPLVPLALLPLLCLWLYVDAPTSLADVPTGAFGISFSVLVVARQSLNFLDALVLNERLKAAYAAANRARSEARQRNRLLAMSLEQEQERATVDALTGVLNRAGINDELDAAVTAALEDGKSFAIGVVDIDSLKVVNDAYGHLAGDAQIKRVAWALQVGDAVVGRIGGDEFVVILSQIDAFSLRSYAREVRNRLEIATQNDSLYPLTASISMGFASCPRECETAVNLLALADSRMYKEKPSKREVTSQPTAL